MLVSNIVFLILILHFVADFICQTDKMAINKSTSIKWLSAHVLTYTLVMSPLALILGIKYIVLQGILHFVVDLFTSKATSYLWKNNKRHWFFVVIGFDHIVHKD